MRKLMMAGCMALLLSSQPLKAQETFREMQYSPQSTVFTLNAPSRPTLRLYRAGRGGKQYKKMKMKQVGDNRWSIEVKGDLKGVFYTFDIGSPRPSPAMAGGLPWSICATPTPRDGRTTDG